MTTLAILNTILRAKTRKELFGAGTESKKKANYHKLARQSHPDMFPFPEEKELATKAFVHLTALWESHDNTSQTPKPKSSYVHTKKNRYTFEDRFYEDDVFNAYNATRDGGTLSNQIWVVKNPQDNDLGSTAAQSLKKIAKEIPSQFKAFFPEFIETFKYRQDGIDRVAVAYSTPDGFYSLRQVMEAYPQGINGRDVAWMFKRMLVTIGNTHDIGLVHGGVGRDSFLVHPEQHGVMLRNWQYSVEVGNPLTAIDAGIRDNYPQSVFDKAPQAYRLDVYMAAMLALELLEANAPQQLRAFFKGCKTSSVPHPADLLEEFDGLLLRVYGEPKFHKFVMP